MNSENRANENFNNFSTNKESAFPGQLEAGRVINTFENEENILQRPEELGDEMELDFEYEFSSKSLKPKLREITFPERLEAEKAINTFENSKEMLLELSQSSSIDYLCDSDDVLSDISVVDKSIKLGADFLGHLEAGKVINSFENEDEILQRLNETDDDMEVDFEYEYSSKSLEPKFRDNEVVVFEDEKKLSYNKTVVWKEITFPERVEAGRASRSSSIDYLCDSDDIFSDTSVADENVKLGADFLGHLEAGKVINNFENEEVILQRLSETDDEMESDLECGSKSLEPKIRDNEVVVEFEDDDDKLPHKKILTSNDFAEYKAGRAINTFENRKEILLELSQCSSINYLCDADDFFSDTSVVVESVKLGADFPGHLEAGKVINSFENEKENLQRLNETDDETESDFECSSKSPEPKIRDNEVVVEFEDDDDKLPHKKILTWNNFAEYKAGKAINTFENRKEILLELSQCSSISYLCDADDFFSDTSAVVESVKLGADFPGHLEAGKVINSFENEEENLQRLNETDDEIESDFECSSKSIEPKVRDNEVVVEFEDDDDKLLHKKILTWNNFADYKAGRAINTFENRKEILLELSQCSSINYLCDADDFFSDTSVVVESVKLGADFPGHLEAGKVINSFENEEEILQRLNETDDDMEVDFECEYNSISLEPKFRDSEIVVVFEENLTVAGGTKITFSEGLKAGRASNTFENCEEMLLEISRSSSIDYLCDSDDFFSDTSVVDESVKLGADFQGHLEAGKVINSFENEDEILQRLNEIDDEMESDFEYEYSSKSLEPKFRDSEVVVVFEDENKLSYNKTLIWKETTFLESLKAGRVVNTFENEEKMLLEMSRSTSPEYLCDPDDPSTYIHIVNENGKEESVFRQHLEAGRIINTFENEEEMLLQLNRSSSPEYLCDPDDFSTYISIVDEKVTDFPEHLQAGRVINTFENKENILLGTSEYLYDPNDPSTYTSIGNETVRQETAGRVINTFENDETFLQELNESDEEMEFDFLYEHSSKSLVSKKIWNCFPNLTPEIPYTGSTDLFIEGNLSEECVSRLSQEVSRVLSDKFLICSKNHLEPPKPEFVKFMVEGMLVIINKNQRFQMRCSTWTNIIFADNRLQLKPYGEAKMKVVRKSDGKFQMVVHMLKKILYLFKNNAICNKREIYYQMKADVKNEAQVSSGITATSRLLNIAPWDLKIFTTAKGLIFGNLKIYLRDGQVLHCNTAGGTLIPSDFNQIERMESDAAFIIVVEKDAIFQKLLNESVSKRLTKPFIMITGKGYPDLATRYFLRRLWGQFLIPAFILVDADPFGIDIMFTYRFGSVTMVHLSEQLAVPQLQWIGVHPSDIISLNIQHQPLTKLEQNKLKKMLEAPYISSNPRIEEELKILLDNNFKAEIESLIFTNIFLADNYLPNKLYLHDFC